MSAEQNPSENPLNSPDMKDIVALCKRRGFIFQASDIYGGINGFWDFGPLGAQLKNNLRDAWWRDMVECPPIGPDGAPLSIVGLDSAIIQNPKVWEASGHVGGFNDPMSDCKETKKRYRADHVMVYVPKDGEGIALSFDKDAEAAEIEKRIGKFSKGKSVGDFEITTLDQYDVAALPTLLAPEAKEPGTLTEPRQFNMMFHSYTGPTASEEDKVYLRPETAQGIFINYKNVMDSCRVRPPFGIAQVGKAYRNEVTPRNFIFRSREFEQMELEWFCHPDDHKMWFEFWAEQRRQWWMSVGLPEADIYMNEIEGDDLAHYSSRTIDIEFRYPFSAPGFEELEGVAHRGSYDLGKHQEHSGQNLEYLDQANNNERYLPHVIEPAAGLTRGVLALISAAYTIDENRPSGVYLNFTPAMAPKKAAILPLTAKPEHVGPAQDLYLALRGDFVVDLDIKQNIGKRYARQDEIGTPYCFTIDNDTLEDQTVTVRERNTMSQERIHLDKVKDFLKDKINL